MLFQEKIKHKKCGKPLLLLKVIKVNNNLFSDLLTRQNISLKSVKPFRRGMATKTVTRQFCIVDLSPAVSSRNIHITSPKC